MKAIIIGFISLSLLISCSHVEVAGFNRDSNSVTIETAGFANELDAQKEADRYCKGPSRLVSMDKRYVGTAVYKTGDQISSSDKNHLFYTFACSK